MKVPLDALMQNNIGTKASNLKLNTAPSPPVCQQNRITIYTYYNRAANPEHIPDGLTRRAMPTTLRHIPHRTIARALGRHRHDSGFFGRKQVTRRHGTSCPRWDSRWSVICFVSSISGVLQEHTEDDTRWQGGLSWVNLQWNLLCWPFYGSTRMRSA
jgi:hypothetical protein